MEGCDIYVRSTAEYIKLLIISSLNSYLSVLAPVRCRSNLRKAQMFL